MRKFLKSKTLKILVCCTLIFTFICFSVSAETGQVFIVPIAKPPASENMGYVEVLARDNSGNLFVEVYIFTLSVSGVTYNNENFASDAYLNFSCNEHNLYFTPMSIGGIGDIDLSLYYVGSSGSFSYLGRATDSTITASFGSTLVGMHIYGDVSISNTVGTTPFTVVYGEDAASYSALLSILSVLQNNNQDIIANDNQNAQAIQDNQDKNTSQILNGWENDSPAESGDIGNLDELESGLIDDANNQADSHRVNINDSVIGSIQRLTSSFGAVSALFQDITLGTIPDISILIYFSIFIGLVPLIVGLSVQGLRARDRSDKLKSRKGKKGD